MVTELTLHLPGLAVAARRWGAGDGLPTLALHGWLDNAASFDRLAPLLPELDLVVPDLPGHGLSDHRPEGMAYHFVDAVADVLGIADALGWERFALIGHSMGAGIASLVPGAAPGRLTHLVVMDGLGPLSAPPAEAPANLARALGADRRARPARAFPDLAAAVAARQAGSDLSQDATRLLVERAVTVDRDGVRFRHDPRLQRPSRLRLSEEQVLAFLAAIDCPTLAVRATAGLELFAEMITARLRAISEVTVVEVAGGHHLHLDNPEGVAQHVRRFLLSPAPPILA